MNLIKHFLPLFLLLVVSCGKAEMSSLIEDKYLTDERFFSKPIKIPSRKLTDEERLAFAKELQSAIDKTKIKSNNLKIVAEGVDNNVLYLTGIKRDDCLSLSQSDVIKSITVLGFRTYSCRDTESDYFYSTPIK